MNNKPAQDEKGRFLPGNNGGGRPKGSRNKLGEDFLAVLQADFREHGEGVISRVRDEHPAVYMKTIASLLPKVMQVGSPMQDLSDDELAYVLDELLACREAELHRQEGDPPDTLQ